MEIVSDIIGLILLAGIVAIPVFFVIATIRNIKKSQRWAGGVTRPDYTRQTASDAGGFDGMEFGGSASATTQAPAHATPHPSGPQPSPCDPSPQHGQMDHSSWFDHHAAPADCAPSHSGSSFDSGSSYDSGGSFSGGFDSGGSFGGGGDGG